MVLNYIVVVVGCGGDWETSPSVKSFCAMQIGQKIRPIEDQDINNRENIYVLI